MFVWCKLKRHLFQFESKCAKEIVRSIVATLVLTFSSSVPTLPAVAAIIKAEATTNASDFGTGITSNFDSDTKTADPTVDNFVDASATSTGQIIDSSIPVGDPGRIQGDRATTTASASANYESGALKAFGRRDIIDPNIQDVSAASGRARIEETLEFVFSDPTNARDIGVIAEVDRIINGSNSEVEFFLNFIDGGFFNTELLRFQQTFTNSGTTRLTGSFVVPSSNVVDMVYRLRAATFNALFADDGLADASNTAFLNFVLPDGVSLIPTDQTFLQSAPDLQQNSIPVPGTIWFLITSIVCALGVHSARLRS